MTTPRPSRLTRVRNAVRPAWLLAALLAARFAAAQSGDRPGETQPTLPAHLIPPPAPALSPDRQRATFELEPGFVIDLVASEPLVQDPVAATFDEFGRLWVVEMLGFMMNLQGAGADQPNGRVSILEDRDQDGFFESGRVFADSLVLPRALCLTSDGALIAHRRRLWHFTDADRDGRAEAWTVVDPDYIASGSVEHQPNGLLYGLDNWIYSANSRARYRRASNGAWIKEPTEFRGQWGIARDDYGRLYYNYNYSQLHGDLVPPNSMGRNPNWPFLAGINVILTTNQSVRPIRMNTGVNRAYRPGVLDERGRLRAFASACAPWIYRGDQFPSDYRGNAFVCGPGANLVKRNRMTDSELHLTAEPASQDREFLASTDERFRPVNLTGGPDGALYIVDMYRGIIQDSPFMTTHLRGEIERRGLDSPIHLGRIWRVRRTNAPPSRPVNLGALTATGLVALLEHPNGWHRDAAQRLLVQRGDPEALPALARLARDGNDMGRLHALWVMEAMPKPDTATVAGALDDSHPRVRAAAMRILAQWVEAGRAEAGWLGRIAARDLAREPPIVQAQAAFSLRGLHSDPSLIALAAILTQGSEHDILRQAVLSSLHDREWTMIQRLSQSTDWIHPRPERVRVLNELAQAALQSAKPESVQSLLEAAADDSGEDFPRPWQREALKAGVLQSARQWNGSPLTLPRQPPLVRDLEANEGSAAAAQSLRAMLAWPGHSPPRRRRPNATPLRNLDRARFLAGRDAYLTVCAGCHGTAGEGLSPLAPPLARSEWVLGPVDRLARIVLHGVEGPIEVNGVTYAPPLILPNMPSVESMSDDQIAGILTYIRRSWDHEADPVRPDQIQEARRLSAGRTAPWTADELLKLN